MVYFMKTCVFPRCSKPASRLSVAGLLLTATASVLAQNQPPVQLKDVVVTATRFAEASAPLPFGVSVITAQDIATSGVNTVNEALMKLLGVPGRLDTSGGNNYSLDLRGFGTTADGNQVVIVDGLRLNEADFATAGLAAIAIESVERIEVLRGTGAVLYGEGATGGVIVVTTRAGSGAKRINSARLYVAAGSNALQDVRASAVIANQGFSLDVSAQDRRSDGHRVNFASTENGLNVVAQWSNEWLRLGARAGRHSLDSGLPGPLTATQYAADPHQAQSSTEFGSSSKDNSGIFVEATLGEWQLAADANQRSKQYNSVTYGSPYGYDVDAANFSLRARHEGQLAGYANVLVLGYDKNTWDRTITRSAFTPAGTGAAASASAFYAKDDLTLSETATRISLGWRSEDLNKSESQSATSLQDRQNAWDIGLSQPVGKALTVYGRIGQSFRLANVDEFSFTTPGAQLKAQTSRDTELGARWRTAANRVELRWYRNELNDEIGYDPAGNGPYGPFGANINFAATRRQGLELETSHALSPDLDVRFNAAVRQASFTAGPYAGKDIALVPGRTLGVRADWRPSQGHTVGAGLNWVDAQSPDFANSCKMPSYTVMDLRYAYQFHNAELALGIANLTDEKYYTQAFGCVAGVVTSIYPEAGRNVTASLRLKF